MKVGKSFQTYFLLRNAYKKEGHLYLPCSFLRKDEQFVIEFEKPSDVSTKAVGPQATITLLEDIKKDTAYKQLPWKYRNDVLYNLKIQPSYGRPWKIRCDMGMVKEFEKWVHEETGLLRDDRNYAERGLENVKKIRYYLDYKFIEAMHEDSSDLHLFKSCTCCARMTPARSVVAWRMRMELGASWLMPVERFAFPNVKYTLLRSSEPMVNDVST